MLKRSLLTASFLIAAASAAYAFAVYGAIGDKYAKLGGDKGALGPAISDEAAAPNGGRFNAFKNGLIYWHPKVGAFAVQGAIAGKWDASGRTNFGYPYTDETSTPDGRGRYNHFRAMHLPGTPEASIYWTSQTNAHAIYGDIRKKWASIGWERSPLGYPTSDEIQDGAYRRVNFEHGHIRWSSRSGAEVFTTSNAPTPNPGTFGTLLVNGIELQADAPGRGAVPVFANNNFLSANAICELIRNPPPPQQSFDQFVKSIVGTANTALGSKSPFKVRSDISGSLSGNCRARAEVSTANDDAINVSANLDGNRISLHMTTPDIHVLGASVGAPGSADPGFAVTFDISARTRVLLPKSVCGQVQVETINVTVSNAKVDGTNPTGDIAVAIGKFVSFLAGIDFKKALADKRVISFPGVTKTAQEFNPMLCTGLARSARIEHDYKSGPGVLVLRATVAPPEKGPVVR